MNKAICPKCLGNKTIQAFSHVAAGVCFMCGGSGEIKTDNLVFKGQTEEQKEAVRAENAKKIEWLINATPKQITGLSFPQLCKARDFASACLSCGDESLAPAHKQLMNRLDAICYR